MTRSTTLLVDLGILLFVSSCCVLASQDIGTADSGKFASSVTLSVERQTECAENGESRNLTCSLTLTRKNLKQPLDAWSLSWFFEGRRLAVNETKLVVNNSNITSILSVYVSWSDQKVFTCVASRSSGAEEDRQQLMNLSVIVCVIPRPVTSILGQRFIETAQGQTVETFWRPVDSGLVVYTLKYCLVDSQQDHICSHNRSVDSQCLFRHRDFYRVPNTSGLTCYAAINFGESAPCYVDYRLYVISQRAGCERTSLVRKFNLATIPVFEDEGTLLLIPHAVSNFKVEATKQREVHLRWSNPSFVYGEQSREYVVEYNCSTNHTIWYKETSKTEMNLDTIDFHPYRPYDLCKFCVKARLSHVAVFSKSVCKVRRLHEDTPTGAPRITCRGDNCKTSSNAIERNVTVTWTLPPREDWNGVLVNVKVIYRSANNRSRNVVSERNLTKGETVLRGLAGNSSYIIQMAACNKEGCGGVGNAVIIPALPDTTQIALSDKSVEKGTSVTQWLPWVIIIVIFCLLAVGVCFGRYRWVRSKKSYRSSLPSICEPKASDYANAESSVRTQSRHYDELDVDKLERGSADLDFMKEGRFDKIQYETPAHS